MFKRLINPIKFSISSDQDVLSQSVVEVLHGKIPQGQEELCNTLYDIRMGTIKKGVECETCSMDYTKCKGHFGHIGLTVSVVNLICLKQLKWIVKHILQEMQDDSDNKAAPQRQLDQKLQAVIQNIDKVALCFYCLAPRTSDDIFDVDNIEDLEEVSKTLTNMC